MPWEERKRKEETWCVHWAVDHHENWNEVRKNKKGEDTEEQCHASRKLDAIRSSSTILGSITNSGVSCASDTFWYFRL